MKHFVHLIIFTALLALLGCQNESDKTVSRLPHIGDTPYQQDSILVAYAANPERALTLLDSALLLGNISDYRAQFIRATIYSKSLMEQRQDSAIIICKALLDHDSVTNNPVEQANILDMLIAATRAKYDIEQYLHWATQKAALCQQQGENEAMVTERWRTEAEIGLVMTYLGQTDEGLAKLDEAIAHLDTPGSIDRMDAFIVAVKRKINAVEELEHFEEVIPLAQRTLDRLDHYEQHPQEYAEDSHRLSRSSDDRDRYLDFSRAQAWGFLAQAYAYLPSSTSPSHLQKAKEYLSLFDHSGYGQTFTARRFIASTQIALGMYDEALDTYAEIERRLGDDTLNAEYAAILRARALAAHAQAATANPHHSPLVTHLKEAYDYQTRYAYLSKLISDSLHRSEAHDYAARYHAQEQKLKIQEKEAETDRLYIVNIAIAVIALLATVFAIFFFHQKRIVSEKNHALVRMINETLQTQSTVTPRKVKTKEAVPADTEDSGMSTDTDGYGIPMNTDGAALCREGSEGAVSIPSFAPQPSVSTPSSDAQSAVIPSDLFNLIDTAIRSERLYSNVTLQRQDICDRFGISRHALNNMLTEHSDGLTFPQYINAIRIQEALLLLRDDPSKTVAAIAAEVGFTPSNLREQFKREYGITPVEFRQNL
jgi:AraC-like DNA-binding protein